jgi:hypothetical protein
VIQARQDRTEPERTPVAWRNRIVGSGEERPDQLLANPANWRVHPASQQEALAGSLDVVGWVQQVMVNRRTNHVVDGHARVALAISRNEPSVPVLYVDLEPEEEALVLASLDPISAMAGTDDVQLQALLAGIETDNEGLRALLDELAGAGPKDGLTDPDDIPEPPGDPYVKPGEMWQLGPHRLLCGDATNADDVARVLDGERPTLTVTDPPYGVEYDASWRRKLVPGATYREGKVANDDRADWSEAMALPLDGLLGAEQQDLLIAARSNWVIAFDNVSRLQPWMSDALCRLSTGGGLGKRQLYTDLDEIVLDAQRPQVLNGITEFVQRGDLLDRAIIQEQPSIRGSSRRSESDFWRTFQAVRPAILGALFDAVAGAMANEASVVLPDLPRMADPTRWVTAAEPALGWPTGTFAAAYRRNRSDGSALALEGAPIAGPLRDLTALGEWKGTATELLRRRAERARDETPSQREWPSNGKALTDALRRLAPNLWAYGIEWTRLRRTGSARLHVLHPIGGGTVTAVTSDTVSASGNDGPPADVFSDRHASSATVTPAREQVDGHDGNDGLDPGSNGGGTQWLAAHGERALLRVNAAGSAA